MSYYVSRQHYYYSGTRCVEIAAGGLDYSGCDMLATEDKAMKRLEGDYDDPREAVQAAIELRQLWQDRIGINEIVWLSYGNNLDMIEGATVIPDDGYSDGGEPYTDDELIIDNIDGAKKWAEDQYQSLAKCARCNDILPKDYYYNPDSEWTEEKFCSENCAEQEYYDSRTDDVLEECEE